MLSDRCLSVCDVRALRPNGWMDQDATWHAGRPRSWPHCVRWGPSSPSPKGHSPPIFDPYLLRPNGCMYQDVTWYGARPRPRRLCARWGPSPLPQKGRSPIQFSAHVYCGQTAAWIKMPLGMEIGQAEAYLHTKYCFRQFDVDPATPRKRVHTHPTQFLAYV